MKTMFDSNTVESMQKRISGLDAGATPRWGSFTAPKMVCHIIDQMEFALSGETGDCTLEQGPPLIVRHAIRTFLPWPKNVPTVDGMLVTQPEEWDADIRKVLNLMDAFPEAVDRDIWPFHPFFGQLNGSQWAKLTWRHTDFHFKQFGC